MVYAPADLRSVFRDQLHRAVAEGCIPLTSLGLGPATLAALAIVALKHPDATRCEIDTALAAFNREHPLRRRVGPPRPADDSRRSG